MNAKEINIWKRLGLAWLVFLVLLVFYWTQLQQSHNEKLASAEQATLLRAEQAAHALAMLAHSQLQSIDFFVEHLAQHWGDHDAESFPRLIEIGQQGIFNGALGLVLVTDADGTILFSSAEDAAGRPAINTVADQEYFRHHAQGGAPLFIGGPIKNRFTGEWTIQFSRAHVADGRFAGVAVVSVSAERLAEAFIDIYPRRDNVVLMLANDGRYLTRSQDLESHLGGAVPADREFITMPEKASGHYHVTAPIDGLDRYYAWHRVPDYPVVLSLGLNKEKALARTVGAIKSSRIQNVFTTFLFIIAAVWISRYAMIRARQHRLLQQYGERMEVLLSRSPSGVLLEDENQYLYSVNMAFCSLLNLTVHPDKLQGMHRDEFLKLLDIEYARHLDPAWERLADGYRVEQEEESGRTLEIECLPISHQERELGRAWFIQDISARKQKERELLTLANVDPLTGLLNRRSFMELLANAIENSQQHFPGALLLLDIDHFKKINDTYGHPAGDQVLKSIAQFIRRSLRAGDYTGRLGGEEFAVLLPSVSESDALLLAERIRTEIENATTETSEHSMTVTISIGVASLYEMTIESVMDKADKALYQAKREGRNRVCI